MRLVESLSVLHPINEGERSDNEPKDNHRDKVPLPALHEHEIKLDGIAIRLRGERKLEHCRVPVLWRPCQSWIWNVVRIWLILERRCEMEVDALVVVLIGDSEDIDERGQRVDGGDGGEVKPEVVDEGGKSVEISITALELTVTEGKRNETAQADNDESRASSAVAGVSLVDEEVLRLAS